jgi:NADH-quinone oxidoreductase subunit J
MSFMEFVIGVIAMIAAIGVVGCRNPLYSAFSLIVHLLAVAGLYALLGSHFLAVSQVVVYAGAIMVLVLFVLMLLNLKHEQGQQIRIGRTLTAFTGGVVVLLTALPPVVNHFDTLSNTTVLDNRSPSEGTVKAIGEELYSNYTVQFELSSLVLLIGIVGAVMLAKRKQPQLGPREGGIFAGGKQ